MSFEPVLMIWDIYDGPRTGLAQYMGEPYYFKCLWNEPNDHFSEGFSLSPIDSCFLQTATIQWKIYRDWEFKFHNGIVELESHPGKRGNNLEYDRLEDELKISLTKLIELPKIFYPKFRPLPNQDDLLSGILRELEANWSEKS